MQGAFDALMIVDAAQHELLKSQSVVVNKAQKTRQNIQSRISIWYSYTIPVTSI